MATVQDALGAGALHEFVPPNWETREPVRPLLMSDEFVAWVNGEPALTSDANKINGRLLIEHLQKAFSDFRCAGRPGGGYARRVEPTVKRVWRIQPPGLRLFGWFYEPSHFVAVRGVLERDLKGSATSPKIVTYAECRKDVLAFAAKHSLTSTMLPGDLRHVL